MQVWTVSTEINLLWSISKYVLLTGILNLYIRLQQKLWTKEIRNWGFNVNRGRVIIRILVTHSAEVLNVPGRTQISHDEMRFSLYSAPLNNQCLLEGTEHKIKTTCSKYTKSVSISHDWQCLLMTMLTNVLHFGLSFWQQFVQSRPDIWKEISLNIWLFYYIKVLTLQLICFCAFNVLFHLLSDLMVRW